MPWLGNGTFARIFSWTAQANAGIDIIASEMDTDTDDITGNGFNNTLTRDGQGSATANLPMNGYVHTGVGNASATNQYAAAGQIQKNSLAFAVGAGTADAITATFSPAIATLTGADGTQLTVRAPGTNTSTTPQFSPNSLTAYTIKKNGGQALIAGDYNTNKPILLEYVESGTYWELLNPNVNGTATTITLTGPVTGSGTSTIATTLAVGSVSGTILANANAANAGTNALGAVTISTSGPSGTPSNGDRWLVYTP